MLDSLLQVEEETWGYISVVQQKEYWEKSWTEHMINENRNVKEWWNHKGNKAVQKIELCEDPW